MSYRFASLSAGLLARKGAAQPAMTSHRGGNPLPARDEIRFVTAPEPEFPPVAALMRAGYQAPAPVDVPASISAFAPSIPMPAPVARIEPPTPPPAPPPFPDAPAAPRSDACSMPGACAANDPSIADPSKRFHVSIRLRQSHFVRLKIASARLRKPGQDIVAEALEAYFRLMGSDVFGGCACAQGGAS